MPVSDSQHVGPSTRHGLPKDARAAAATEIIGKSDHAILAIAQEIKAANNMILLFFCLF